MDIATGQIEWTDLTAVFGDLAPGDQVTVFVEFIAEHPQTAIVNRAEAHDVISSGGSLTNTNDTAQLDDSIGGATPLLKQLSDPPNPTAGLPMTFTISITNDGAITTTVLPLMENFDPAFLQFSHAVPPPDVEMTGVLSWTDLTTHFGDIPAFGSVDVTVVFTALGSIINTVNEARVENAVDWFNNDLTGGQALVPITIIAAPTATETPAPNPTNTPQPAAPAPAATNTPIPTPTATAVPATTFPETGIPPARVTPLTAVLALIAAILPGAVWIWRRQHSRNPHAD